MVFLILEFPNVRMKMKFVISGLVPSSEYVLQVYAVNLAGSSVGDFTFFTLNKDGGKDLSSVDSIL